jgi:hypothetical protein
MPIRERLGGNLLWMQSMVLLGLVVGVPYTPSRSRGVKL